MRIFFGIFAVAILVSLGFLGIRLKEELDESFLVSTSESAPDPSPPPPPPLSPCCERRSRNTVPSLIAFDAILIFKTPQPARNLVTESRVNLIFVFPRSRRKFERETQIHE